MFPHSSLRHSIALTTLLLHALMVTSCSSWRAQVKPAREALELEPLSTMRIDVGRQDRVVVEKARIEGDSLVGSPAHAPPRVASSDLSWRPIAIPLGSIRGVEVRKFSAKKTTLLVLGISGVIVGALFLFDVGAHQGSLTGF